MGKTGSDHGLHPCYPNTIGVIRGSEIGARENFKACNW